MKRASTIRLFLNTLCVLLFLSVSVLSAADPADKPCADIHHVDRFQEKAEIVKKGDIDFVMLGDSITHLWDVTGSAAQEKYFGQYKRVNLALGWNGTQHVLWELENIQADAISPKAVMLMIGTNNIGWLEQNSDETAAGIRAILDKVRALWPEAKILLLAVFPRDANEQGNERIKINFVNEKLPAFADNEHIFFLNINDQFLTETKELPTSLFPDLLHPNAQGYEIWGKAVQPTLAEWLK